MSAKYGTLRNFINGGFVDISSTRSIPVISPVDGAPLAEMPCSSATDLDAAVKAARADFDSWSIRHVKRHLNAEADRLVNESLDAD